ncbi:hypothetical protein [Oceanobacillus kapialis]|uniref:Uncharacterized protein n=1 Tax=Oceanobacillus kapialis TaxID=481353 RepID=A0ABW5PVK8_9BACI
MRKFYLLLFLSFILCLSGCTQGEEEPGDYSGIVNDGKAIGYQYTLTLDKGNFSWEIGYKGNTSIYKESAENEKDLENFKHAVDDSQSALTTLMITGTFLLIVVLLTFFIYKKNKNMLKGAHAIIVVVVGFAIYHSLTASVELSRSLQDAEYYYLLLRN